MPARKPEECDLLLVEELHQGDLEAAVALYEPTATYVLDSGETVTGHAAIREILQGLIALKPKFTVEGVTAIQSGGGDVAVTHGKGSLAGTDPEDNPITITYSTMEVVRRQADGSWRFVIDNPNGGK